MSIKFILSTLFLILKIWFIFRSSEDPVFQGNVWTPQSLYDYVNKTYLNLKNPRWYHNINHMIVDPENYLQFGELEEAYQYMKLLYEKYNISSHVFFISSMKKKFKTDEEIASFVSKLAYLLYKNYEIYDEYNTLTAVFFIKDRKMRIRTSKSLRENWTDYDCLNILNRRKNDLINNNFQQVVNGLIKDIYNTFTTNYETKEINLGNYSVLIKIIIIVIKSLILFGVFYIERTTPHEKKVKAFLDKLKQRENPKEIFPQSCIICLEDFLEEKVSQFQNSENIEKDEISILECGHKFHRKCIVDWLKKKENCPMCRMKFDIKGNSSNNNKGSSSFGNNTNINFRNILNEILRIQSDINKLNLRQIYRIRDAYSTSSSQSNSYTSKSARFTHSKSYSSCKRCSGGATSGW